MKKELEDKGMTRAQLRQKMMPEDVRQALAVLFTPDHIKQLVEAAEKQLVTVREIVAACTMDHVRELTQTGLIRFGNWKSSAAGREKPWPSWPQALQNAMPAEKAAKVFAKRAYKEWLENDQFHRVPSPTRESAWLSFIDEARAFGFNPVFIKIPEQTGCEASLADKKRAARAIRKAAA